MFPLHVVAPHAFRNTWASHGINLILKPNSDNIKIRHLNVPIRKIITRKGKLNLYRLNFQYQLRHDRPYLGYNWEKFIAAQYPSL